MAAGGLLGALAASSCCIVPLTLFGLGVSGAWIGNLTWLAPYQPCFIVATLGFVEACEAYIKSQAHEGWRLVPDPFDDGAFSGGSLDRPALQKLLSEIKANKIDVIVVYKVDRLTRSLSDFAKLVELFDAHSASFVQTKSLQGSGKPVWVIAL